MLRTKRLKIYDRKCNVCDLHIIGMQERVEECIERGGEVIERYQYFRYFVAVSRDGAELKRTQTTRLKETVNIAQQWFKEHSCTREERTE